MNRLAICLVLATTTFAAPQPAAAANLTVFDTVDAVRIGLASTTTSTVVVTGILAGGSTPVTLTFTFNFDTSFPDMAPRCERLAVVAMAKPGKFQFAIGSISFFDFTTGGCKLILRTT